MKRAIFAVVAAFVVLFWCFSAAFLLLLLLLLAHVAMQVYVHSHGEDAAA